MRENDTLGKQKVKMEVLDKIIVENGITYVLREDELYYPELKLETAQNEDIGKYGLLKLQYLQNNQRYEYLSLLRTGKLNSYLSQLNEECYEYLQDLMRQMKNTAGVCEKMKQVDQMKWVRQVNNIQSAAEEIVLREMVYNGKL